MEPNTHKEFQKKKKKSGVMAKACSNDHDRIGRYPYARISPLPYIYLGLWNGGELSQSKIQYKIQKELKKRN